jgi:hypothetical protein
MLRGLPADRAGKEAAASAANKQILCGFGIDVEAVAGWLGSYDGQDSPFDISRGLFAGEWARHGCSGSTSVQGLIRIGSRKNPWRQR